MTRPMTAERPTVRRPSGVRRGAMITKLLIGFVVVGAVVGGGWYLFASGRSATKVDPILETVVLGPFEASVLEQGQLESSDNVDFRCEVKSRYGETSVISVIPEGTQVKEGDVLIELDRSKLEQLHQTQLIAVASAEKLVQQASSTLQAAEIAKVEYLEGKFEEAKATIQSEIFVAEEELRKAEEYARFSERLAAKSFVTELQLEADLFAVDRYRNQLELARQKLRVLEQQTKPKEIIGFDSQILSAQAELASAEKARDLEVAALTEIEDQLAKCTITVPKGVSGQVVYANVYSSRGNSEWVLEEGAPVRERQVLVRLPNFQKMQIFAKVNEAQISAVEEGQSVEIQVDSQREAGPIRGIVTKVNPYAEPESWSSGGIRRYGVTISIQSPPTSLRPGGNASVSILTRYEPSAKQIPVQAFVKHGEKYFAVVKVGDRFETREIEVIAANAKTAWIGQGLEVDDQVVLGPRTYDELLQLPDLPTGPREDDEATFESESEGDAERSDRRDSSTETTRDETKRRSPETATAS